MSGNILDCCKNTSIVIGSLFLLLIFIAISVSTLAIGIADVVIGAKWNNCHLSNDDADIYLIVSGSILISFFVINVINTDAKSSRELANGRNDADKGPYISLLMLLSMAMLGILIWGMTIVWKSEQGDCNHGQYNYLYYRTIILMFMSIVVYGTLILVGCGYMCCMSSKFDA